MLMLVVVAVVLAVGLVRGGSLHRLAAVSLRWPGLVLAGMLLQLLIFTPFVGRSLITSFVPELYLLSMAMLAAWVAINWRTAGILVAGAGLLMNMAAIAANGGYMPVDPRVARIAGQDREADPLHNNSIAVRGEPRLWFLTDILPVPAFIPLANVYSVGDVAITLGASIFVYGAVRGGAPRPKRRPAPHGRRPYPTDIADEEWALLQPYLALAGPAATPSAYEPRELVNAMRYIARSGAAWQMMPNDLPPWQEVEAQARRWSEARVFAALSADLRALLELIDGYEPDPRRPAADLAARLAAPARSRGRDVQIASGSLGELLTVLAPGEPDREELGRVVEQLAQLGGGGPRVAPFDPDAPAAPERDGDPVAIDAVLLPEARRGLVLLPRRWLVEQSLAWTVRLRRLARDYERLPEVLRQLPTLAALVAVGLISAPVGLLARHLV